MNNNDVSDFSLEQIELKGFSRSIAELEWLLLVLVLLYFVAPGTAMEDPFRVILAMLAYAGVVLAFRYLKLFRRESAWKLAVETWLMVAFITVVLWETGGSQSPLLNLYLLGLIMAGLTLGKVTTILQLALIATLYFYTVYADYGAAALSLAMVSDIMAKFAPFLLTTYLVTMIAADVHYAKRVFRLLSETDELTGLQNRRAFNALLQQELRKAERSKRSLSILMIDADRLKPINDTHGHDAGDRFIKLIADAMRETLRASDSYARYGGDEFIALLPESTIEHAQEAAERIRTRIANASFDADGRAVSSTVSIGIACYPEHGRDLEALVRHADQALYRCKGTGGNAVVLPSAA